MLSVSSDDGWLARLAKMIPAEGLAFYGTAASLVPADGGSREFVVRAIALGTIGLILFVRYVASKPLGKVPWFGILLSCGSFVIWTSTLPAVSSPFPPIGKGYEYLPALCAFVWVTGVTTFYRGETP